MNETIRPTPAASARVLRYAAFTDAGSGGNPAGVVLEADDLDDHERLAVAADVGFSETAFLNAPDREGRYRARYFSPRAEVAFCGHATIAAAVAIAERNGGGLLQLDTLAGPIPVQTQIAGDEVSATLVSAATRTRPASEDDVEAALGALRWRPEDLDPRYPVHVAHGGVDHLILAVRERARLAELDYDFAALDALMSKRGWTTVHLVQAQTPLLFHARDPFPPGGVVEDPATGAAAAAFGGYLASLGLVDPPATITIVQGEDMGRPSRLVVDVHPGDPHVRVTGTAAAIAPASGGA
jgi:PhzF family phenazine biosynthesis protein